MQRVPEGFHHEHKSKGVAVVTDIDDGSPGAYNLPPPSTAGALAAPAKGSKDSEQAVADGHVNDDDDEDARWIERAGWAPRFGNGDSGDSMEGESLLDHQTWMEGKIEDKFYGGNLVSYLSSGICANST